MVHNLSSLSRHHSELSTRNSLLSLGQALEPYIAWLNLRYHREATEAWVDRFEGLRVPMRLIRSPALRPSKALFTICIAVCAGLTLQG